MNDASFVRRFEPLSDLSCDSDCFLDRNRPSSNPFSKRRALDEFQHERSHIVRLFDTMDGGDVWMVERTEDFSLALEACEPIRVGRKTFGKDLDCDVSTQAAVAGAIDLAHAAVADRLDDVKVGGEDLARSKPVSGQLRAMIQERIRCRLRGEHPFHFSDEQRASVERARHECPALGRRLLERRLEDFADAAEVFRRDRSKWRRFVHRGMVSPYLL